MNIRPAIEQDLPALDAIALEAKAHWGYSQAQIDAWRGELLTSRISLRRCPAFVAEADTEILGFAQLDPSSEPWQLAAMWIRPRFMRRGIGRALVRRACHYAANCGQRMISIDADPNAEPFYLACGASVIGHVAAPIPGNADRIRPQLLLSTSTESSHEVR